MRRVTGWAGVVCICLQQVEDGAGHTRSRGEARAGGAGLRRTWRAAARNSLRAAGPPPPDQKAETGGLVTVAACLRVLRRRQRHTARRLVLPALETSLYRGCISGCISGCVSGCISG